MYKQNESRPPHPDKVYRAYLKGLSWLARIQLESSVSGRLAVFRQAVLLVHTMPPNLKMYMPFSEALYIFSQN